MNPEQRDGESGGPPGLALFLGDGRTIEIPPTGTSVLGSGANADVVIEGLADAHCAIGRLARGGWALRDLGSTAGSRVNGSPVESTRIAHGDRIELGRVQLRVTDPGLEALPATEPPAPVEDEIELPPAVTAPRTLGGFRILRPLGRGATGEVVLAVQKSLDRHVALKLLAPALAADREFVRRFQTEARAAASLNHPNVVVVYDVGEAEGRHYLAMEYMERGSLEARVARDGPLPWPEVIEVLIDAAAGLAYAEQRGIVHRDIKPANLMQSAAGTTKIADLGLAQPVAQPDRGDGTAAGTPHFIAPEQARGAGADHRSDLYSLGATAFRLLTGRTPFAGDTTREILQAVFAEPAPSAAAWVQDVPPQLDLLIARCLAKEPGARPGSARELILELERVRLRSALPHDTPVDTGGRTAAKKLTVVAAIAILVGAAWVVVDTLGGADPPAAPDRSPGAVAAADTTLRRPEFGEHGDPLEPADVPRGEASLRSLEREADRALTALDGVGPDARRDGLAEVIAQFRGTTAASRAERELMALESSSEPASTRERAAVLEGLRGEVTGENGRSASENLRVVRTWTSPPSLRGDGALARGLLDLERELLASALARAADEERKADDAAVRGEFALVADHLTDAIDELDASDALRVLREVGSRRARMLAVADLDEVVAHDTRLKSRLLSLADEERAWRERRAGDDAVMRSRGFSDLEAELRRLDATAAAERLEDLAATLATEEERGRVDALGSDVRAAAAALDSLVFELDSEGWRRRSVLDPRPGRPVPREIVASDARGLLFAGENGVAVLPWSALAARPDAIDALFKTRLAREYSAGELEGIAALVRFAAVLRTVDALGPALGRLAGRPESAIAPLDPELVLDLYTPTLAWAERAGDAAPALAERAAALRILEAVDATERESWTEAALLLEETLEERVDTLLVLLLSDGT